MEAASRQHLSKVSGFTGDRLDTAARRKPWRRANKRAGVWMPLSAEEFQRRRKFDDPTAVHDGNPITDKSHHCHVM